VRTVKKQKFCIKRWIEGTLELTDEVDGVFLHGVQQLGVEAIVQHV